MGIDRETIERRLRKLEENLALLKELKGIGLAEFLDDLKTRLYAAHLLQTAIQCVIDIGSHLVLGLNLGRVERYSDIPEALANGGIIPAGLSRKLKEMIGLRNILVHGYLEVDYAALHRFIQTELRDFEEFAAAVASFLDREGRKDGEA
ncbi:DUF86 domain-containing protein [Candidatus Bipolaricaulota bacterium]|nr:DUF86 domain-containing protein [Candidatus Bipolaricaulota bacterium]